MLNVYVPQEWKHRKAAAITRSDIRELLAHLAERIPIQANRVLSLLRAVFNFGLRWDIVETNPAAMIAPPAPENPRDRVLSAEELRALWTALAGEDAVTAGLFKLYLFTAQRGGEIRTMRWADVDLVSAWWMIPKERAKNGLAHRVPLSAPAVAVLQGLQRSESPFVFSGRGRQGY